MGEGRVGLEIAMAVDEGLKSELQKHGIYVDLNMNVARAFQPGDGVKDTDQLGFGKAVTLFDPQIIELQKEF